MANHQKIKPALLAAVVTVALGVLAAGCGSSSKSATSATSTTSLAAAKCGTLTKSTINIVDITDQTGIPGVPFYQLPDAEGAALKYVNEVLCGVDGHPLKLTTCDSMLNPAATAACANKAVTIKPFPVDEMGASIFLIDGGSRILHAHGLITQNGATTPQDAADPDSFPIIAGATAEFPGAGYLAATQLHAKHATVLVYDTPEVGLIYHRFASAVTQQGVTGTVGKVLLPQSAINVAPFAVKAASGSDAIVGNISGPALNSLYQNLAQQGFSADKTVMTSAAADSPTLEKAGAAADGAYFTAPFSSPDFTTTPQQQLYHAVMAKYGSSYDARSELSEWGFSNLMTLYSVLKKIGGNKATAATVSAYFHNTATIPVFLGGSLIKKAAPKGEPAVRNLAITALQWDNGKLNPVNGGKFFTPPTATIP